MNEQQLDEMARAAKHAMIKLHGYRVKYRTGAMTYVMVKELGMPHIDTFNKYAKALAKARGVRYRGVSLVGYLR